MAKTKKIKKTRSDYIKFLGTAGARFVMIKQLRSSGGLWIHSEGTSVLVDPGPGSVVRCALSRPKLDPSRLDAVILTHRHLDHCNDINVMIEAMTEGGFSKRGIVFCPADALGEDPVIFRYIRNFPREIVVLKEQETYSVEKFVFQTSMRHIHPVETYGLKFTIKDKRVGLLADTKYFDDLKSFYDVDILIIGVVFYQPRPEVAHLSVLDVKKLIAEIRPKRTILTHFGMGMLKAKPHEVALDIAEELSLDVQAAYDGMTLTFE